MGSLFRVYINEYFIFVFITKRNIKKKNQQFPASLDNSRKEARLIMDAFCGAWKVQLDKSTGVEEFRELFSWTEEKAKQYSSLQYTVEYTDDGKRCVVDYGVQKLEFIFKLGEQFEYTGIDGLKAKCTPALDGNKLIENFETDSGLAWKTVREVNGSTMTAVTTLVGNDDVKCVQVLNKI
ncbi:Fatty acid-binding protein, intestinal [Bulinus truncatus]|nr:Fatty acid-binding protein, intestinal [Bulinus truncatus]